MVPAVEGYSFGGCRSKSGKPDIRVTKRTSILEEIVEGIRTEFTVYNNLYDNGYENYDNLLDSSEGTIIDSNVDPIVARAYSSSLILDSNGQPIDGRVIFCIR